MTDPSFLAQIPELLSDWIPETASIAVANREKYVVYRPGAHDLRIAPGDAVRPGSIAEKVFSQHERVELDVGSSVFGIPYHGLGYPLQIENDIESALAIILPPTQRGPLHPLSYVMGQAEGVWRPIPIEDIAYFESYQKKTWFHTQIGSFTTDSTIQGLENRLPPGQFLRIHRSFIINIKFIDFIQRDDRSNLIVKLKIPSQTCLSVSQTYVRHVRDSLGF